MRISFFRVPASRWAEPGFRWMVTMSAWIVFGIALAVPRASISQEGPEPTQASAPEVSANGRESAVVKGLVFVDGEFHRGPTLRREGMKNLLDDVLAMRLRTWEEGEAVQKRQRDELFSVYVLTAAGEAANELAIQRRSVEEINRAFVSTFKEKAQEEPGTRTPAKMEIAKSDGLHLQIRVTEQGHEPYIENVSLLGPEAINHEPPRMTNEERAHDVFQGLVRSVGRGGLMVINPHGGHTAFGGDSATRMIHCIERALEDLAAGKNPNRRNSPCRLGQEFLDDLRAHIESGGEE